MPTLNHYLIGSGQWGFLGGKGFFLSGPAYDAASHCLALFEVVFMETAGYIIVGLDVPEFLMHPYPADAVVTVE